MLIDLWVERIKRKAKKSKKRPRIILDFDSTDFITHGDQLDAVIRCGMTKDANSLLQEALQLTPEDRAKLAAELLSSLDDRDEEVQAAWAAEITRRAADADADSDDEEDCRVALNDVRREVLSR